MPMGNTAPPMSMGNSLPSLELPALPSLDLPSEHLSSCRSRSSTGTPNSERRMAFALDGFSPVTSGRSSRSGAAVEGASPMLHTPKALQQETLQQEWKQSPLAFGAEEIPPEAAPSGQSEIEHENVS